MPRHGVRRKTQDFEKMKISGRAASGPAPTSFCVDFEPRAPQFDPVR